MTIDGNAITFCGRSHIKEGACCEDSSAVFRSKDFTIIAIADGHGSYMQTRSNYGSKVAVEQAITVIKDIVSEDSFYVDFKESPNAVIDKIKIKIMSNWLEIIDEHLKKNILTVDEQKDVGVNARSTLKYDLYGTTLLITVMSEKYLISLQIGDGSIFSVNNDGLINRYVKLNQLCDGDRTTSMCDEDALNEFMHNYSIDVIPAAIVMCSDGFDSAFCIDDLQLFIPGIVSMSMYSDIWYGSISEQIRSCTRRHKEDDTSFAVIYNSTLDEKRIYECIFKEQFPYLPPLQKKQLKLKICNNGGISNDGKVIEYAEWETENNHYFGELLDGEPAVINIVENKKVMTFVGKTQDYDLCGDGELYDGDVLVYKGHFKNGHKNGYGREFINGLIHYEGEFLNDYYDGNGILYSNRWNDTTKKVLEYKGEFRKGHKYGNGEVYSSNGELIKKGYQEEWYYLDEQIQFALHLIGNNVGHIGYEVPTDEKYINKIREAIDIVRCSINVKAVQKGDVPNISRIIMKTSKKISSLVDNPDAFAYYVSKEIVNGYLKHPIHFCIDRK